MPNKRKRRSRPHNKQKYANQFARTAQNKQRNIAKAKKLEEFYKNKKSEL